jgi:hypothetical protein
MRKLNKSIPGILCLTACIWQLRCGWDVYRNALATSSLSGEVQVGWLPEEHEHVNATLTSSSSKSFASDREQPDESFSACLLTKDDNHWLVEWLAYHYHVLPLRQLILVRDPSSRTSPVGILNRWKGRIDITEWTDDRVLPPWVRRKFQDENLTKVGLHRYRQQFFYAKCLQEFNARNQTWVLLSDVDEFIRPNPYLATATLPTAAVVPVARPGSVLTTMQNYDHDQQQRTRRTTSSIDIDPKLQQPKCLHVPRIQIATKEVPDDAPPVLPLSQLEWNASHFLTTRWLFHSGKEIRAAKNLNGKNVVNVKRLLPTQIPRKVDNVHTVIPDICPSTAGDRLHHADSWLLIQHYAGTFEQYSYRDDPRDGIAGRPVRMNRTIWQAIGQVPGSAEILRRDNAMLDWLPGFVESVGASEAALLLAGVGVVGAA